MPPARRAAMPPARRCAPQLPLALLLLALVARSALAQPVSGYAMVSGINFGSNDVAGGGFYVLNPAACAAACSGNVM